MLINHTDYALPLSTLFTKYMTLVCPQYQKKRLCLSCFVSNNHGNLLGRTCIHHHIYVLKFCPIEKVDKPKDNTNMKPL